MEMAGQEIQVNNQSEILFCPSCGTRIASNALFCYKCGNPVGNIAYDSVKEPSSREDNEPAQHSVFDIDDNKGASVIANKDKHAKKVYIIAGITGSVILVMIIILLSIKTHKRKDDVVINTTVVETPIEGSVETDGTVNEETNTVNLIEEGQVETDTDSEDAEKSEIVITGNDVKESEKEKKKQYAIDNYDKLFYSKVKNGTRCPLSIRPIPNKEYQDVYMVGYALQIPMGMDLVYDSCDEYLSELFNWGELKEVMDSERIMINLDEEDEKEATILIYNRKQENLSKEDYFEGWKIGKKYLGDIGRVLVDEITTINNMEYSHTLADVAWTASDEEPTMKRDLYLTINNGEALSVELNCDISKYDTYKKLFYDVVNSIQYVGGGSYDECVLFIRDHNTITDYAFKRNEIDDGLYIFEDLISMDYDTFLSEIDEFDEILSDKWVDQLDPETRERGLTCAKNMEALLIDYKNFLGQHIKDGTCINEYTELFNSQGSVCAAFYDELHGNEE